MAAQTIRYPCPHCGEGLAVDDTKAGLAFVCPKCQKATRVPGEIPDLEAHMARIAELEEQRRKKQGVTSDKLHELAGHYRAIGQSAKAANIGRIAGQNRIAEVLAGVLVLGLGAVWIAPRFATPVRPPAVAQPQEQPQPDPVEEARQREWEARMAKSDEEIRRAWDKAGEAEAKAKEVTKSSDARLVGSIPDDATFRAEVEKGQREIDAARHGAEAARRRFDEDQTKMLAESERQQRSWAQEAAEAERRRAQQSRDLDRITPGMTMDRVRGLVGGPQKAQRVGNLNMWYYQGHHVQVVFTDGLVTDVNYY